MSMSAMQGAAFLIALNAGLLLGALYDACSAIKAKLPPVLFVICDVVYYLLFFCVCLTVFYEMGAPRGFAALGLLLGFLLFKLGAGALIKFFRARRREKKEKGRRVANK